jgi:large subunit ribosomal protein L29
MKKDKLSTLDPAEQEQKLREIGEQQFRIKFQMSMGQTEGLRKLREMRKDKARLLTYLRSREIEALNKEAAVNKEGAKK